MFLNTFAKFKPKMHLSKITSIPLMKTTRGIKYAKILY